MPRLLPQRVVRFRPLPHAAASFNQITAHNAGWPSQFRLAVNGNWCGACEFVCSAKDS